MLDGMTGKKGGRGERGGVGVIEWMDFFSVSSYSLAKDGGGGYLWCFGSYR